MKSINATVNIFHFSFFYLFISIDFDSPGVLVKNKHISQLHSISLLQFFFSLKCRTPLPSLANVVYKFKCLHDANNIYIGKTIRHLATRVKEHGTSPSNSAVSNHLTSCETCKLNFSCDNFSIIDSGKND